MAALLFYEYLKSTYPRITFPTFRCFFLHVAQAPFFLTILISSFSDLEKHRRLRGSVGSMFMSSV